MRSISSVFLHIIAIDHTNKLYNRCIDIISGVPTRILCKNLRKQLRTACWDRSKLVKSLHLSPEEETDLLVSLPKYKDNLWNRLRFCGSGISQEMFDQSLSTTESKIYGNTKSNHKVLIGSSYSKDFLDTFEYLWKRGKALRRIEWSLLGIGSLSHRDKIIYSLSDTMIRKILKEKTNLIDIIAITQSTNHDFIKSIGTALLYKAKYDPSISKKLYKYLKEWLDLDTTHCVVILAESFDYVNGYDIDKLLDRFKTRIRSDKQLTGIFKPLIIPKRTIDQ